MNNKYKSMFRSWLICRDESRNVFIGGFLTKGWGILAVRIDETVKANRFQPPWPHLAVIRSLQNRRYFFAFYRRAKTSAKRLRRALDTRHARGKHFPVARVCCSSRASFALTPGLRSPEKRGKITPVMQANYFVTLKV